MDTTGSLQWRPTHFDPVYHSCLVRFSPKPLFPFSLAPSTPLSSSGTKGLEVHILLEVIELVSAGSALDSRKEDRKFKKTTTN